jgi:putative phosphoesterase
VRIGVISDTHDYLDPKVPALFTGVDHIIHAGDVGLPWLILQLENIAPVTVVLGNTDVGLSYKETAVVVLGGRKFLVHHVVDPKAPAEVIKRRIIRENPEVVVFGHTHKPFSETLEKTLYFNPGYAGKSRFGLPRTVAILHCGDTGITSEFKTL